MSFTQNDCDECTSCKIQSSKSQTPSFFDRRRVSFEQHHLDSPPETPSYGDDAMELYSDDGSSYSLIQSTIDEGEQIEQKQDPFYSQQQQQQQRCQQLYFPILPPSPSASISTPMLYPDSEILPTQPSTTTSQHQHQTSTISEPSVLTTDSAPVSPPSFDRSRRSVSQACHARNPLDSHRRLPRAVTPDLPTSSSTLSSSRDRLYSPMAAGFARLGQKHRSAASHHQHQQRRASISASLLTAEKPVAARSLDLLDSMALVAKLFDGPA